MSNLLDILPYTAFVSGPLALVGLCAAAVSGAEHHRLAACLLVVVAVLAATLVFAGTATGSPPQWLRSAS